MRYSIHAATYVPAETESQEMADKTYNKPIIVNWKIVAGNRKLHPLNLYDVFLNYSDFRIRKMDPKTRRFINFVY